VGVEDDRQGHFFHGQTADGLTAEVGPRDDFQRLDALGHQRTGTAQRSQIDRAVADDGLFDGGVPLALADHNFIAQVQQTGAHGVHPSAGGGAGRADDFARALRRGADVVDGAALEVKTRDDLSTAYTPGVAEPCRKIRENPDDVYKYTFKGNMVAVVSNGTAVLGLGDIGPEAGLPVMEGKAVLFKEFGGVDAFPICIDAHDAASVIAACKAIAPTFGGINLEDIKSPECFEIEETLERELDIPVFHDDQHGTAIVVTAALINALRVVGKKMEDVHIVLNGPGAAGTAIIKMLMTAGAKDIIAVDQFGTLYKGCNSAEAHKNWLGEVTNPRQIKGGLKEALEGADVFIGVSKPGILTTELCRTMNKDAIVFAMANPTPEIMPDEAKAGGVRVMATGRSDFPNQVNNVLCFPGLFKGALSVRARDINDKMKLAAAYAIADLITDDDRSEENIIPGAFDPRVAEAVANAVAKAARESGVARL
jgi:malate dehydrogenase (oxaloacetate-decarboxylating)